MFPCLSRHVRMPEISLPSAVDTCIRRCISVKRYCPFSHSPSKLLVVLVLPRWLAFSRVPMSPRTMFFALCCPEALPVSIAQLLASRCSAVHSSFRALQATRLGILRCCVRTYSSPYKETIRKCSTTSFRQIRHISPNHPWTSCTGRFRAQQAVCHGCSAASRPRRREAGPAYPAVRAAFPSRPTARA